MDSTRPLVWHFTRGETGRGLAASSSRHRGTPILDNRYPARRSAAKPRICEDLSGQRTADEPSLPIGFRSVDTSNPVRMAPNIRMHKA